jgi:hypothetical protein
LSEVIAGPFDPESIMLYSFEPLFYKTTPSRCAPTGNGRDLSDGDRRALALLYPYAAGDVAELKRRAARVLDQIQANLEVGFEGADGAELPYRARVVDLLNVLVDGGP